VSQAEIGPSTQGRFCPSCGQRTDPGQRFCGSCGQELTVDGGSQQAGWAQPPQQERLAGAGRPPLSRLDLTALTGGKSVRDLALGGGFSVAVAGGGLLLLGFVISLIALAVASNNFATVLAVAPPNAEVHLSAYPLFLVAEGTTVISWLFGVAALIAAAWAFLGAKGRSRLSMLTAAAGFGVGFLAVKAFSELLLTIFYGVTEFSFRIGAEAGTYPAGFPDSQIAGAALDLIACLVFAGAAFYGFDYLQRSTAGYGGGQAAVLRRVSFLAAVGFLVLMGGGISELTGGSESSAAIETASWGILACCCFAVGIAFSIAARLSPDLEGVVGEDGLRRREGILASAFAVAVVGLLLFTIGQFSVTGRPEFSFLTGSLQASFWLRAVGVLFVFFGGCGLLAGFGGGWWERRITPAANG
jgi:hypothetical protein